MRSAGQGSSWRSALRRLLSDARPRRGNAQLTDTSSEQADRSASREHSAVPPECPADNDAAPDPGNDSAGDSGTAQPGESSAAVNASERTSAGELDRIIEEIVLHAPRRYTRRQVHAITGISEQRARQLWRSMGFADVEDDEVVFTDSDLAAIGQLEQLSAAGLVPPEVQEAVTRSIAQAMAGLATWQAELLYQVLRSQRRDLANWPEDLRNVLPSLERMQSYVWRRHLVTAAGRLLTTSPDEADLRTLVVGSSDLVGFTRIARRLTPEQLIELVEMFHGIAAQITAAHRGRIVKTVGDAVLFVTDHPADAAELALELLEQTTEAAELPELRTGLAYGRTLTRFGDIYGEVVDNASRLCTHARPGRILVDHTLASALEGDPRFQLRMRPPINERGYPGLRPWSLRRAPSPDQPSAGLSS